MSSKNLCYCCSEKLFKNCCEPFLKNKLIPESPELLMRSRYSAFCELNLTYVQKTMQGKALQNFNLRESLAHAQKCKWTSLKIIFTSIDENKISGLVEFLADYRMYGKAHCLHEKSEFIFVDGRWFYISGVIFP